MTRRILKQLIQSKVSFIVQILSRVNFRFIIYLHGLSNKLEFTINWIFKFLAILRVPLLLYYTCLKRKTNKELQALLAGKRIAPIIKHNRAICGILISTMINYIKGHTKHTIYSRYNVQYIGKGL